MKFSLVIPCYNESKNIPLLIKKNKKFLKNKNHELILVNNGSSDKTNIVFKKFNKLNNIKTLKIKKNKGFGNGLIKGIIKAKGKYIIYSHADLELDPKNILLAIQICKKNILNKKIFIKGNRIDKINNHWTISDIFFSYSLTLFSTFLFRKKLYDIHGIPVLFSKELIFDLQYFPKDFSIDLYFYLIAIKKKFKIIRYPVNFNKKNRKFGIGNSSSLVKKIKGSLVQFCEAFKILWKLL